MTAVLRDVHWTDLPLLAGLEREMFPGDAWDERTWWAELAGRPRRSYVVAVDPAAAETDPPEPPRIAGYAGVDLAGDTADVMTVAVRAAYRGRGVGDALLSEIVCRAAASGAAALLLEVRADHGAALALYRRHGFEQVAVRRRYYQPDDVDALVLRRLLGRGGPD